MGTVPNRISDDERAICYRWAGAAGGLRHSKHAAPGKTHFGRTRGVPQARADAATQEVSLWQDVRTIQACTLILPMTATVHHAEPQPPGAMPGLTCPVTSPDAATTRSQEARHAGRLIVNADDFGLCAGVNQGIIEAHERGIVTSASLMVRYPAAEAAAEPTCCARSAA